MMFIKRGRLIPWRRNGNYNCRCFREMWSTEQQPTIMIRSMAAQAKQQPITPPPSSASSSSSTTKRTSTARGRGVRNIVLGTITASLFYLLFSKRSDRVLYATTNAASSDGGTATTSSSKINARHLLLSYKDDDNVEAPIYRIVLTGGPCGGKSSAMVKVSERFQSLGFQVFIVTEIATLLLMGGAKYDPTNLDTLMAFESSLIKTQMSLEDCFINIAKATRKPTILLCDRGVMDVKAYMDSDLFQVLLADNDWTVPKLRDMRYDMIIHMVSAAIGAEKYYTLANNDARTESIETARQLDYKLRETYVGHPHLFIVDNSTDFPKKIQKVVDLVSGTTGQPVSSEHRRKFLIEGQVDMLPVDYQFIDTEQIYLDVTTQEQKRIQKRGQQGIYTYTLETTRVSPDGKELAFSTRPISVKNYVEYAKQADPMRSKVFKTVRAFIYKEHYFELNTYRIQGRDPVTLLTIEPVKGQPVELPDFLKPKIIQEVTLNPRYASFNMSLNT